jgi:hypothetical protein
MDIYVTLDQSLHDGSPDKIRKYHPDYNNNPPSGVGFMTSIVSTPGRLHSEFIRILFLQTHRETDRFFSSSGVLSVQSDRGFFHYLRSTFSSMLKSRVGNILAKAADLRINLNLDGAPIASKSHTHPSHSQTSRSVRRVDSSFLVFSLSSHRHSYISLLFSSRFIDS